MSVYRRRPDGSLVPAEPIPEPFGILWERLWNERRRRGEWKWPALVTSFQDARAICRLAAAAETDTQP